MLLQDLTPLLDVTPLLDERYINQIRFIRPESFRDACRIVMTSGNDQLGYAILTRKGDVAERADLCIYDRSRPITKFLPCLRVGKNHRGRGHGSLLLEEVLAFCERNGITEIQGKASGNLDVLVPWYKRHGFTVGDDNSLYRKLNA